MKRGRKGKKAAYRNKELTRQFQRSKGGRGKNDEQRRAATNRRGGRALS